MTAVDGAGTPTPDDATDMTPQQRALRDAWLAEMWPVCPEESSTGRRKPRRTAA